MLPSTKKMSSSAFVCQVIRAATVSKVRKMTAFLRNGDDETLNLSLINDTVENSCLFVYFFIFLLQNNSTMSLK